jgi:hypothetical protein
VVGMLWGRIHGSLERGNNVERGTLYSAGNQGSIKYPASIIALAVDEAMDEMNTEGEKSQTPAPRRFVLIYPGGRR